MKRSEVERLRELHAPFVKELETCAQAVALCEQALKADDALRELIDAVAKYDGLGQRVDEAEDAARAALLESDE